MPDVFVSFATEDRELAESALRILESKGFSCWVAWRDIQEGIPYAAAIVKGIREARLVLVLLTPSSRDSPHVLREVETAVIANRPVLCVQIAGSLPDEALGYYLGPTQWLRNDQRDLDDGRLLLTVRQMTGDLGQAAGAMGRHRLRQLSTNALVWALLVTGFVILAATMVLGPSGETLGGRTINAVGVRGLLLFLVVPWLIAGLEVEHLVERKRAPYNALRGRLVPSYAFGAILLTVLGLSLWRTQGQSFYVIFAGDGWGGMLPDFNFSMIDEWPLLGIFGHAFSFDDFSWSLGFSPLITVVATAMILAAFSLVIIKLIRPPAVAAGIVASLPFLAVRCHFAMFQGNSDYQAPLPIYWAAPVLAGLMVIVASFVLSEWGLSSSTP